MNKFGLTWNLRTGKRLKKKSEAWGVKIESAPRATLLTRTYSSPFPYTYNTPVLFINPHLILSLLLPHTWYTDRDFFLPTVQCTVHCSVYIWSSIHISHVYSTISPFLSQIFSSHFHFSYPHISHICSSFLRFSWVFSYGALQYWELGLESGQDCLVLPSSVAIPNPLISHVLSPVLTFPISVPFPILNIIVYFWSHILLFQIGSMYAVISILISYPKYGDFLFQTSCPLIFYICDLPVHPFPHL